MKRSTKQHVSSTSPESVSEGKKPDFPKIHFIAMCLVLLSQCIVLVLFIFLFMDIYSIMANGQAQEKMLLDFVASHAFWRPWVFLFSSMMLSASLLEMKKFSSDASIYCCLHSSRREMVTLYSAMSQCALILFFLPSLVASPFFEGRITLAIYQTLLQYKWFIGGAVLVSCLCFLLLSRMEKAWKQMLAEKKQDISDGERMMML